MRVQAPMLGNRDAGRSAAPGSDRRFRPWKAPSINNARATSVLVLGLCHKFLRFAPKSDRQLHPPEISLMQSQIQASKLFFASVFQQAGYRFFPSDLWVQAILTGVKSGIFRGNSNF